MEDTQNLGTIIKRQRKRLGLTLKNLAKESGVSFTYLGRIEQGERYPSPNILRKIARPLKFTEKELFNLAGYLPGDQKKEAVLEKHKSLAELDILINRVTADLNRIRSIVRDFHKKS